MKTRLISMGAIPSWGMGARRSFTLRFAYAARSWVHTSAPVRRLAVLQNASFRKGGDGVSVARTKWAAPCFSLCRMPLSAPGLRSVRPSVNKTARTFRAAAAGSGGGRTRSESKKSKSKDPLQPGDSKHIDWWEQKMANCQKPSTQELIKRLVPDNLLGLDTSLKNGSLKEGCLARETLEFKRRFPHEVILTRVGEFYECSGFDACVLVEYAGLNPMGGVLNATSVPRAGCPIVNLRQTLDALTSNDFSVCIVEEVKGPSDSRRRKDRFIAGHAHPGSPFVYGLAAADFDVEFPDPVSIVGIARSALGYCLISVVELMRTVSVEDQLTEEAVVAKLRAKPRHRLYLHKSLRDKSTDTVRWGEFGEGGLLWAECRGQSPEWYDSHPVSEVLSRVRSTFDLHEDEEFRRIVLPPGERPRPLNVGTAIQVGILPTHGVPSLLRVLLPPNSSAVCVAYLRDLLLNPPPYRVAVCIQSALQLIMDYERPVPDFTDVSAAKLVKLIGAMEANHLELARIRNMSRDVLAMERDPQLLQLLDLLLDPTWLATGLRLEQDQLVRDCDFLDKRLDEVLAPSGDPLNAVSKSKFVPVDFFDDMEGHWKERVRRENVEKAYFEVERAAASLADAIEEDLHPIVLRTKGLAGPIGGGGGGPSGEIAYSREHRAVWFRGKRFRPTLFSGGPGEEEIKRLKEAKDAKGKKAGDEWFTTSRVENALELYRSAVERASNAVVEFLKSVSKELQCKLNAIVFLASFSIVAKTLFAHASEGKRRRWVAPSLSLGFSTDRGQNERNGSLVFEDMFPYWLDKTQDEVVLNSIELESMILLTGPNGGGKSSVLRSICAAALVGTCGLMVPARKATVPRLDSIMLRMMIADSPADSKSSFQMEMSELRTILCEATNESLVLVDELCKGTEVNKGTFIVASVLEHLDKVGCLGVISTHLHGILDLDLNIQNVVRKAMEVVLVDGDKPKPTWRLVDGVCRESLAFETARREGVLDSVVERAEALYQEWKNGADNSAHVAGKAVYHDSKIDVVCDDPQIVSESVETYHHFERNGFSRCESAPMPLVAPTCRSVQSSRLMQSPQLEVSASSRLVLSTTLEASASSRFMQQSSQLEAPASSLLLQSNQLDASAASSRPLQSTLLEVSAASCGPTQSAAEGGGALDELKPLFLRICMKKLSDLYEVQLSPEMEPHCQCFLVGSRQKPPPMTTNRSCVYILQRPDGRYYVGQTDNISGRIDTHRSSPGLQDAPFLYVPVRNRSVACELETCLIKQLPPFGYTLVNKGDQNHRYFGTAACRDGDNPPF